MTDLLLDHLKRALGESYTIERELLGGGMSRVFVARERALGREVVVKVLPRELSLGVNRERFQQEVQLAARLSHPYIVPLLHAGEHEDLLWFTMPFIPGESLKAHLERTGPMPVREVVQFSRDVVEALAYAHSRGVIHRDIKPANILVDGGHALVTDFGVAKALSAALPARGEGHTATGMAIGTPSYMAPEQLAADPAANHRVDIYALGLLMYELLAGASPFSTPSPTATMTAQLTRMPEPLDKLRSDVPAALSGLITHCLAKSPDERPASADAVLKSLDLISGEMAAAVHLSGETRYTMKRMIPVTAALALVAVVAVAAAVTMRNKDVAPPTVPTIVPAAVQDTGNSVALQSPTPAPAPLTHEDSVRIAAAFNRELPGASNSEVLAKLDQVQKQMDSMAAAQKADAAAQAQARSAMIRIPGGDPGRATMVGGGRSDFQPPAPRKVYVFSNIPPGMRDSTMQNLSTTLLSELTTRLGRNWEVVHPDPSLTDAQRTAAYVGADAWINLELNRRGVGRDSVAISSVIRSKNGEFRVTTPDTVARGATPAEIRDAMIELQRSFFQLTAPPRVNQGGQQQRGGGPVGGRGGGPPSISDSTPPVKRP